MTTRLYREGGGVELTPEVRLRRYVITPTVAAYAARTAYAFLHNPDRYSYVHKIKGKDGQFRTDQVSVGWWRQKSPQDMGTIWADHRFAQRHASFVEAAHALVGFSGGEPPDYVNVYFHDQGVLPMHPDRADYKRSLLMLDALKLVTVSHANDFDTFTVFPVATCDAYSMQFRNDDFTVLHEIDNVNDNNLALFISN